MKRAVFPGSFDPITRGHLNILERSLPLFDEIILGVGVNSSKHSMYSLDQRTEWLKSVCQDQWLIRGVRNGGDFEYERTIAQMTKVLHPMLETVILFTDPEFAHIHSNVVREILKNGGDVSAFVPEGLEFPSPQ